MTVLPLTLFGMAEPAVSSRWAPDRIRLDECCWVDIARGFLDGADELLARLEDTMEWHRGRRLMYGTWFDEPRHTGLHARAGHELPSAIQHIRAELTSHYDRAFTGLFCNYYRSGSDGVAWHADRIGRTEIDPLVAIVSLGGPRTFLMRPFGGGDSERFTLHSGDLLIMGGASQHHWEHAVPKCEHAAPRISVTMRAGGELLSSSTPGDLPVGGPAQP
jgi:alkylated DNA repair dioxygenase AlkB